MVYHPSKTDITALKATVRHAEEQYGWEATRWVQTEAHDAGTRSAQRLLDVGVNLVIASGGDGTVRAVAEALRGTGVPMAVVPEGTGNLLARNIGLPLDDQTTAVRAAFAGENRAIDLGIATIVREDESEEEHVFLVLAGMGLDARTISATKSSLKKRVGWLAYVEAGLQTMIKDRPLRIHYSYDGSAAMDLEVYTVMIGNCGYLPGGVLLIPDARLDDGELDVVALRPLGAFSWVRIWNKIGWENGVLRKSKAGRKIIDLVNDTKSVTYLRAKKYALSVTEPEPLQLDGDDFGRAVAIRGTVDPGSLLLRVLPEWKTPVPDALS